MAAGGRAGAGVVASESQSLIWAGSVPRKAVTIIRSLARVQAWVSWSGKGGVNRVWWCRTSSKPHWAACSSMAARSL